MYEIWIWSETKFVLGLPRAKQVSLEHCKKKHEGTVITTADPPPPPPVRYDHDHRLNGYFFDGFPKRIAFLIFIFCQNVFFFNNSLILKKKNVIFKIFPVLQIFGPFLTIFGFLWFVMDFFWIFHNRGVPGEVS